MRKTLIAVLALLAASCGRAPKTVPEVVSVSAAKLPSAPDDRAWERAPEHAAKMIPQDLVEPRLLEPTTAEVRVRSLNNGSEIVFRLEWADADRSDRPLPGVMADACAIQIPEKIEKDLPEPQMGQEGKPVQVTYWRADWQAAVDGRGDSIRDLYPNASVDHYPFEAKVLDGDPEARKEMERRYAPARALGNLRAGPRAHPVEDLISSGPGTLAPGPPLGARGSGKHDARKGWSVVIGRKLPQGLEVNQRTHIAFAVWQGAMQEAGARKMRTGWIPLVRRGE